MGNQILLQKETESFDLRYQRNDRTRRDELHLVHKGSGRHRAIHTHFNVLDKNGKIKETQPITLVVAEFIFSNFESRGDTESFNIYESDLQANTFSGGSHISFEANAIRHAPTTAERAFTATGEKLLYHWPIFQKFRDTGYGSIIRATMTNHQVCASRCHYCSTIARNRKDQITLDEAKEFVRKLYFDQAEHNRRNFSTYNDAYSKITGSDIRLKGLILSGGGQPNLWPHFSEFVAWLSELEIDLGLITNGFPPSIDESIYENFKWIRISITPEDASPFYVDQRFDRQYIPEVLKHNEKVTVGYSYVFGPWTEDEIFERIVRSIEEYGFEYCRTLTDCNLTRTAQLRAHESLAGRLFKMGFLSVDGKPTHRIFHQLKYHGTQEEAEELWDSGQCYLQIYNVFWDTTGHEENGFSYCYPCDSVTVLSEQATDGEINASERKFNASKWGTHKSCEVEKLFAEPVRPFFDPKENCASCLFVRNNRTVQELIGNDDLKNVGPPEIEHVNFP